MSIAELITILNGELIDCRCHGRSSYECICDDAYWPDTYCKQAATELARLTDENAKLIKECQGKKISKK